MAMATRTLDVTNARARALQLIMIQSEQRFNFETHLGLCLLVGPTIQQQPRAARVTIVSGQHQRRPTILRGVPHPNHWKAHVMLLNKTRPRLITEVTKTMSTGALHRSDATNVQCFLPPFQPPTRSASAHSPRDHCERPTLAPSDRTADIHTSTILQRDSKTNPWYIECLMMITTRNRKEVEALHCHWKIPEQIQNKDYQ